MPNGSNPRIVAIIAPCFPPSNLTAAQRPRLLASHLSSFGYKPVVFTVRERYYEGQIEPDLNKLVGPDVEVIRVNALPAKPIRVVGDIALRAMPFLRPALDHFLKARRIDIVYVPTPPNYGTITGVRFGRRHRIPVVADFTDPWVQPLMPADWRSLKALGSHLLARLCEPYVAARLTGIASVAPRYVDHILPRFPKIATAFAPMGFEPKDVNAARGRPLLPRVAALFGAESRVVVYAGALLPRATEAFRAAIASLADARRNPTCRDLRLAFIGTGSNGKIEKWANEFGVSEQVEELPERIGYLDVLAALSRSHAVFVPGSSERHYTPSKIFSSLLSDRPVLAALHADSSAVEIARKAGGVELVLFDDASTFSVLRADFCAAWHNIASMPPSPVARDFDSLLSIFSARETARTIAALFDRCLSGGRL